MPPETQSRKLIRIRIPFNPFQSELESESESLLHPFSRKFVAWIRIRIPFNSAFWIRIRIGIRIPFNPNRWIRIPFNPNWIRIPFTSRHVLQFLGAPHDGSRPKWEPLCGNCLVTNAFTAGGAGTTVTFSDISKEHLLPSRAAPRFVLSPLLASLFVSFLSPLLASFLSWALPFLLLARSCRRSCLLLLFLSPLLVSFLAAFLFSFVELFVFPVFFSFRVVLLSCGMHWIMALYEVRRAERNAGKDLEKRIPMFLTETLGAQSERRTLKEWAWNEIVGQVN